MYGPYSQIHVEPLLLSMFFYDPFIWLNERNAFILLMPSPVKFLMCFLSDLMALNTRRLAGIEAKKSKLHRKLIGFRGIFIFIVIFCGHYAKSNFRYFRTSWKTFLRLVSGISAPEQLFFSFQYNLSKFSGVFLMKKLPLRATQPRESLLI